MSAEFTRIIDLGPFCPNNSCNPEHPDQHTVSETERSHLLADLSFELQDRVFGDVVEAEEIYQLCDVNLDNCRDFIEIDLDEAGKAAENIRAASFPKGLAAFWGFAGRDGNPDSISVSDLALAFLDSRAELAFLRDKMQINSDGISIETRMITAAAGLIPLELVRGEASLENVGAALFEAIILEKIDISALRAAVGGDTP